ncbi:hypothetical protein EI94DRAFT_1701550 [Lactarius quietus]|nr:hypothetical protein EI94DRAFT_1701550 [Lactarius quietus]
MGRRTGKNGGNRFLELGQRDRHRSVKGCIENEIQELGNEPEGVEGKTMSQVPSTSKSSTNFETIFTAALEAYKKQTKRDIASHPLASQLKSCDSSSAILAILRSQVQTFDQSQNADEKWTKWLDPTVNILFAFSATLANGGGVVFPPANAIFTGIGVLLQAIKDVRASKYALIDLFGRMEYFFKRLEAYVTIRPTAAMVDIIVKIMVEARANQ